MPIRKESAETQDSNEDNSPIEVGMPIRRESAETQASNEDNRPIEIGMPIRKESAETQDSNEDNSPIEVGMPIRRESAETQDSNEDSNPIELGMPIRRESAETQASNEDNSPMEIGMPIRRESAETQDSKEDNTPIEVGMPIRRESAETQDSNEDNSPIEVGMPIRRESAEAQDSNEDKSPIEIGIPIVKNGGENLSSREETTSFENVSEEKKTSVDQISDEQKTSAEKEASHEDRNHIEIGMPMRKTSTEKQVSTEDNSPIEIGMPRGEVSPGKQPSTEGNKPIEIGMPIGKSSGENMPSREKSTSFESEMEENINSRPLFSKDTSSQMLGSNINSILGNKATSSGDYSKLGEQISAELAAVIPKGLENEIEKEGELALGPLVGSISSISKRLGTNSNGPISDSGIPTDEVKSNDGGNTYSYSSKNYDSKISDESKTLGSVKVRWWEKLWPWAGSRKLVGELGSAIPKLKFRDILPRFKMYKNQLKILISRMVPSCPEVHSMKLLKTWVSMFRNAWPNFVEMTEISMKYAEDLKLQLTLCLEKIVHKKYGNMDKLLMKNFQQDSKESDETTKVKRQSADRELFIQNFNTELADPMVNYFAKMPQMVQGEMPVLKRRRRNAGKSRRRPGLRFWGMVD
jgi:hypothetical protein